MCNKMSDVRLSNASPTVERVDLRQQDNVRLPVRRNLFGRPDPEETRRIAEESEQEEVRRFMETYDFDPVEGRPLPPRSYAWAEDHDAPEYYRRPPHQSEAPRREDDLPVDNNRQSNGERSERSSGSQPDRNGSRKRSLEPAGSCSTECQSKRSCSSDDDDDDQSDGAGSQAITAVEDRPSRPEECAELQ